MHEQACSAMCLSQPCTTSSRSSSPSSSACTAGNEKHQPPAHGALGAELISNTLSCQSHLMMALRQVDGLNVAVHHARHRHHKPSQEPCISDKHPGVSMLKGESHGTPLTPCAGL